MKQYLPKLILFIFFITGLKSQSQTVNVPYQFYLDANNNCNYDGGETLLYNLVGSASFTYVNTSSASVAIVSTVTCASSITINNPQIPPVNSLSFVPTMTTYATFSINASCPAYSNLSYTATNYLPVHSINPISNLSVFSNITGFYSATSNSTVFPICSNIVGDTLDFNFQIDNIYTCAGANFSRTYSITLDGNLLDVLVVNGSLGPNIVNGFSCTVNESYWSPTSTVLIRSKLSNTGLAPGNHLFEIKSTPLFTSTLSVLNYSCMLNAVPCTNLSGSIYEDCDNNCFLSPGEGKAYYAAYVKLYNSTNTFSIYPAYNGSFSSMVPMSSSQYSITSVPVSINFTPCATATQTYVVPTTILSPYNFGYKAGSYVDPSIYGPSVAGTTNPGDVKDVKIYFSNYPVSVSCVTSYPLNPGRIKAVLDKNFTYLNVVGATPIPNSIVPGPNGDTLIWNVANMNVGSINYVVSAQMASTVTIGTGYINYAMIYPTTDDILPNNFSVVTWTVGLPFDPNNKISWASGIQPNGDIPIATTELFYTINFQNIGTAPAINVRSLDTLDVNLDWNTLQVINSSFPVQVQIDNVSGATYFNFININLPDSNSNEPGSHGYVHYKIKLKPSVPVNTVIKNRAHNYFDFMPGIATNQTKNKLVNLTGINEIEKSNFVYVAPNPITDKLTISSKELIQNVLVLNNLGQVVMKQDVSNSQLQMDLSSLQGGIYFLNIHFKDGSRAIRKVIKN